MTTVREPAGSALEAVVERNEVGFAPSDRATQNRDTWSRRYSRRLFVTDFIALVWSFAGAQLAWAANSEWRERHQPFEPRWILASASLLLIWHCALGVADTRDPRVLGAGPEEYKRIVNSTVFVFGVIAFVGYAARIQVPRSYVLLTLPMGLVLIVLTRWCWRNWLLYNRQQGKMTATVVVVGGQTSTRHLIETLNSNAHAGYRVIGVCLTGQNIDPVDQIAGTRVLGGVDNLACQIVAAGVDGVIIAASDAADPDMVRRLGWDLEGHDVEIIVAPALANIAGPRVHTRPVAGLPLLLVERPSYQGAERWLKITFDRLGSLILLALALPVLVFIAAAIKLTSRGPVFFIQERAGRDGDSFGMFKFRTMVDGADGLVDQLSIQADAGNAMMFKLKEDPRVTKVGRFLRRYSLDELPQIFNVFIGDMSLVGPRPPLLREVLSYESDARRRLLVRPGVTGLWQISGRSDLNWEETVRLDLYYVENWSLVGDLVILWRTARAVLSARGAY